MITREQLPELYDMAISGAEDPDSSSFYCGRMVEFIGEIIDDRMTADLVERIGGEEELRQAIAEGKVLSPEESKERLDKIWEDL